MPEPKDPSKLLPTRRWARFLWTTAGLVAVGLGVVGIVVPVLPTTPFLLAASFFFFKGSPKLHRWLHSHPSFGPLLVRIREKGLSRREKVRVWLVALPVILLTAILVDSLHLRIFLVALVVVKTVVLWRIRTAPEGRP